MWNLHGNYTEIIQKYYREIDREIKAKYKWKLKWNLHGNYSEIYLEIIVSSFNVN